MSLRGDSIYNYIITTPKRKEYLIKLKLYNTKSQTDQFMANEIQKIMQTIRIRKFVVIVTDNESNLRVAHQIVYKEYPFILNLRCKSHTINLLAFDLTKIDSIKAIISDCNSILEFFNRSHAAYGYYKEQLVTMKIKEFYSKCCQISLILKPIKDLTNILEARNTNLAECFVGLVKLRFGLKQKALNKIYETALLIWYNLGHTESSCLSLLTKLKWKSINVDDKNDQLQVLATFLFLIVPSQAVCERNFSTIKWLLSDRQKELKIYGKDVSENELKESFNHVQQIENSENEDIEENTDLQKILSTNLSISQVIDLSLPTFLATNNSLFESTTNRLTFRDLGNMNYNPIDLAQQIVNKENSEISNDSYN
ncbi:41625_t:CDS:2 [Gigaspora margarita]|uniref:41625_t:CDS:1 n=1 Tax=Gigaspora margarita TaxID=4874 RepID=A0ABN7UIA4_GIGMA|nr:41625_t:CDS:2 [Gigaspora margarita]